jgi:hypothetical protein
MIVLTLPERRVKQASGHRSVPRPLTKEHAMATLDPRPGRTCCGRCAGRRSRSPPSVCHPGPPARREQLAEQFDQAAGEEYFGHFAEQAREAGVIGMEAENLHLAIEEAFEAEVMYRDFQAQAQAVGDHPAADRFRRLGEDQRRNRDQFLAALRALDPADPAE